MATVVPYKQYSRQQRRASLETDYSHGMMYTDGVVDDGYLKCIVNFTYDKDGGCLIPRPSIRPHTVIFPDMHTEISEDYLVEGVSIKDGKQCIENGVSYHQFILGKTDDTSSRKGKIWVNTAELASDKSVIERSEQSSDVFYTIGRDTSSHSCYFYTSEYSSIHDIPVETDGFQRVEFPVGSFAYGNSFYFFGEDEDEKSGLFKTVFDPSVQRYVFDSVEPKELSVSEAVAYGYNMLAKEKGYEFEDKREGSTIQLEGILPYDLSTPPRIMMTPKKNQPVSFRCYYSVSVGKKYDIVWEWRETTASDWTLLQKSTVVLDEGVKLEVERFVPPAKDIMIRVSAYPYENDVVSDIVEKALTVGFDFTAENYGVAGAIEPEVYDLTTATGMESWKNRLVVWGLPKDPTILFISDYDEPSYFPYPNNITVFDSPIIYAVEFMDGLAVFTTDKLYYVTLQDDGNSWKTELLQSHLSIESWDKHLIQTVRNMLFFKSGNYYYMMVPKAQSTTGELTLAPITTPITNFFDNFSLSVQKVLSDAYDYNGEYNLLTYYNYLDYEDVHNTYVFKFSDTSALVYIDVMYNTVSRVWKIWVYEAVHILFPYKHNATETGLMASTTLLKANKINTSEYEWRRFIQLFMLDSNIVRDYYLPYGSEILYDDGFDSAGVVNTCLVFPDDFDDVYVQDNVLFIPSRFVRGIKDHTLYLTDITDYYNGFFKSDVTKILNNVFDNVQDYYTFMNYQFIDSGYRNDNFQAKKRYRELQIQLNNLDKKNMQFGMDYVLDGSPRKIFYKYDVNQAIDEFNDDYGVVYIDSTPYLETDLNDIDITNQWSLDQNLEPDISLWKVRVAISGKGYAPRLRLYSRNEKRFELISVNWISKIMNMR